MHFQTVETLAFSKSERPRIATARAPRLLTCDAGAWGPFRVANPPKLHTADSYRLEGGVVRVERMV